MLVGRSLQGVGGGGIIALSEIIVTDLVPLRVRGVWFGYLSSMWALGSVTGPVSFAPFVLLFEPEADAYVGVVGHRRCLRAECVVEMDLLYQPANHWPRARLRHRLFETQFCRGVVYGEAGAFRLDWSSVVHLFDDLRVDSHYLGRRLVSVGQLAYAGESCNCSLGLLASDSIGDSCDREADVARYPCFLVLLGLPALFCTSDILRLSL